MKKKIMLLALALFLAAMSIECFIFYKTTSAKQTQTVWIAKETLNANHMIQSSQVEAVEMDLEEHLVKRYYIVGRLPQRELKRRIEPGTIIMQSHFLEEDKTLEEASMALALTAENAHLFECEAGESIDLFTLSQGQSKRHTNIKVLKSSASANVALAPGEMAYVTIQTQKEALLEIYEASINGSVRLLKKRHRIE